MGGMSERKLQGVEFQRRGLIARAAEVFNRLRGRQEATPTLVRKPNTAEQFIDLAHALGTMEADIEIGFVPPDKDHPNPRVSFSIRHAQSGPTDPEKDNTTLHKKFVGGTEVTLLTAREARNIFRDAGLKVRIFQAFDDNDEVLPFDKRIELTDDVVDQRTRDYEAAGIRPLPISMPIIK